MLRRGAALGVSALALWGVFSHLGGVTLPALGEWSDGAYLAQTLLEVELGAFQVDEPSLWQQMVTSELPLLQEEEASEVVEERQSEEETLSVSASDAWTGQETASSGELTAEPEEEAPSQSGDTDTTQDSFVVGETITDNANTLRASGVAVNNSTGGISVDPAALAASILTQTIAPADQGPQILITHTHGSEAYTMAGDDVYVESDTARTADADYNMLRVGEEMKAVFESLGFSVLHDTTLYDYPSYTGSYTRSLAGVKQILAEYPSISVVLDVHRDALIADDGTVYKAVTQVEGTNVAQVMLVVGTNDGGLEHPNWQENLNLAAHIQLALTEIEPTLARPINLRSQRFNQHLTPCYLLVEVGTSGNTLQEALAGARYFAQAAGAVYQTLLAEP
jgi:stage II sporulation protein P